MARLLITSNPHLHSGRTTRRIMLDVIIALLPAVVASVVLFSTRALLVLFTSVAVALLSEESISLGSMPMAIPDFTEGMWINRDPAPKSIFNLTEVDESLFEGKVEF